MLCGDLFLPKEKAGTSHLISGAKINVFFTPAHPKTATHPDYAPIMHMRGFIFAPLIRCDVRIGLFT